MKIYQSRIDKKIDVHTHLFADTDCLLNLMDVHGIDKSILLAMGMDNPDILAYNESICLSQASKHPDRLSVMMTFDLSRIDDKEYDVRQIERLERGKEAGAVGIKVSKELGLFVRDSAGALIAVDDSRLDPIWEKAGELGMPVLIHIADPPFYWRPIDENNPWRTALGEMPHWSYHGRHNFPSFEDLIRRRDSILRNHPDTTFIGAHLGSMAWDMGVADVAACLDEFSNLFVDASAVVDEVGRHPEKTRELFLTYADRIMHGTDLIVMSAWETQEEIDRWVHDMARYNSTIFRFYETAETMPTSEPRLRGWQIRGIDLPDDVLEKIYYKNAQRIIPGL